jgi:hypothetical protein
VCGSEVVVVHVLFVVLPKKANIQMKHLQYRSEIGETYETYTCNIHV